MVLLQKGFVASTRTAEIAQFCTRTIITTVCHYFVSIKSQKNDIYERYNVYARRVAWLRLEMRGFQENVKRYTTVLHINVSLGNSGGTSTEGPTRS